MDKKLSRGEGRLQVSLRATTIGPDWLVYLFNENAHIGAVALGEYDAKTQRSSVSVITRLGHKDDAIAQKTAYLISKSTRKTVCVTAGIHLDNITQPEIPRITENALDAVEEFLQLLK
jgi:gallate decarboxylase subunit D